MHSVMNVSTSVCTELQSRTCLLHMTTPSPCFHQQIKRSDQQKKTKQNKTRKQPKCEHKSARLIVLCKKEN